MGSWFVCRGILTSSGGATLYEVLIGYWSFVLRRRTLRLPSSNPKTQTSSSSIQRSKGKVFWGVLVDACDATGESERGAALHTLGWNGFHPAKAPWSRRDLLRSTDFGRRLSSRGIGKMF